VCGGSKERKKKKRGQAVVVHAFNSSMQEAEAGVSLEFEASLVYRVSSRTARATQRNAVSNQQEE
jgi:Tat protein secretion system quality control protein TatD with DNase activity